MNKWRAAALIGLMAFSTGSRAQSGTPLLDSATRKEVVESLARTLSSDYAFESTGHKLAATLRENLSSGHYDSMSSGDELAAALTADLVEVAHDKHLRVTYGDDAMDHGPGATMTPEMREHLFRLNGGIPKIEILPGNIGYLRSNGFPELEVAQDAIAAAFAFLHHTDALIIDLRTNGGGDPHTVALVMSYLSEGAPYVLNTFHDRHGPSTTDSKSSDLGTLSYGRRKPVFALTAHRTFSGGEELAYDIQSFKRGTIVGEVTGGGANPGGPVPLGHHFVAFVPSGYPVNPVTKSNWEGVGVKPDISVPADQALNRAQRIALETLTESTTDASAKAALRSIAADLESRAVGDGKPAVGRPASASPVNVAGQVCPHCAEWNAPQKPFQIYGNTYYVGPHGLSSILITSDHGHILIDGDLPESAPLIEAHIRALGFRIEDVKLVLNSHTHHDHAGGIADLQRASGAVVAASPASARVLEAGTSGVDDPQYGEALPFPAVPMVRRIADGETLRVGTLAVTAHFTPGHTPGGTSWSWDSCERGRCLHTVYADSQTAVSAKGFSFTHSAAYPTAMLDFHRGLTILENLPCDILLTPHPEASSFWERFKEQERGQVDAFVDSDACRRFVVGARRGIAQRALEERRAH